LKNLEGCEHCKIPGCGNKKMDSKSICVGCQNYKKRVNRPVSRRAYGAVCTACAAKGLQKCEHCKKSDCVNSRKKGRRVCQSCDKQDHVKCSQDYRERKDQRVYFSEKRKEHAKEEKAILQEVNTFNKKTVHYVHPTTALQRNCLPAHQYTAFQFYHKELLDCKRESGVEKPNKIRVLDDKDFGRALDTCLPMTNIMKEIADTGKAMLNFQPGVSVFTLAAATLHIQDDDEAKQKLTTIYPPHTDKLDVGQHVMFHQVSGWSFTFIAVEGKGNMAHFNTSSRGYKRYEIWKALCRNEAAIKVETFEKKFFKQAGDNINKTTSVEVYELMAGESLCFKADYYCHASIVPAQVGKTRRALLVFHQLIAVPTFISSLPPRTKKEAGKKKDTLTDCIRPLDENKPGVPGMEIGGIATLINMRQGMWEERKEAASDPPVPTGFPRNAAGFHGKEVLFLGMAYLDLAGLRGKLSGEEMSHLQPLRKEHIELLVRKKLVQTQDGRDMWRILAVEEQYGCEVYTNAYMSHEPKRYSAERHFQHDWNLRYLCESLQKGQHVFEQICLDYFWLQPGWQSSRMTDGMITTTIIDFAKKNLLRLGCKMVLPFTTHILGLVLQNKDLVNEYYEIQYRLNNKTDDLVLYTGTCSLDMKKMASIFEKDLEGQARQYLSHSNLSVKQSLAHDPKQRDSFMALKLDLLSVRFIVLKRRK